MKNTQDKWNQLYTKGRRGKYPNEMLIRFISSMFKGLDRSRIAILDLGFGTGRHLVYLAEEGFNVSGIESSENAANIARAWLRERKLKAKIKVQSFLKINENNSKFNAVIDIASIQHNSYGDIKRIVAEIYRVLKPGGYVFSYIKNKDDSLYRESKKLNQRTHIVLSGKLDKADQNTIITFLSKEDIVKLYAPFSGLFIEKETWTYNDMKDRVSHWIVIAKK